MHVYKGVRSCPTKTYYTPTHGKINQNQLYLSLYDATMTTEQCMIYYDREGKDTKEQDVMRRSRLSVNRAVTIAKFLCKCHYLPASWARPPDVMSIYLIIRA